MAIVHTQLFFSKGIDQPRRRRWRSFQSRSVFGPGCIGSGGSIVPLRLAPRCPQTVQRIRIAMEPSVFCQPLRAAKRYSVWALRPREGPQGREVRENRKGVGEGKRGSECVDLGGGGLN